MKQLILLRHAKAVAKSADDYGRVLADQGRDDMKLVAAEIAADGLRPDLALVSPAARTLETWERSGIDDVPVRLEGSIYEVEADGLLALIQALPDEVGSVMLVGHNPAIEDLADLLGDAAAKARIAGGLPTGALLVFRAGCGVWEELYPGSARLERYATPASLRAVRRD